MLAVKPTFDYYFRSLETMVNVRIRIQWHVWPMWFKVRSKFTIFIGKQLM